MPKLTTIKTGLASVARPLSPFINQSSSEDQTRTANAPWRRWYSIKRWKDIRWQVLQRDKFTCQLCGHLESNTSLLVCDHIEPHRGDPVKFWSGPFQCLCSFCHSVEKQSQERGAPASSRPSWLLPSKIPLIIVCGPPASGKTTLVNAQAKQYDLVIDLDVIGSGLSGQTTHGWDKVKWLNPALRKRNAMLSTLSRTPRWNKAWFIVSEPIAKNRQWWVDKLKPHEVLLIVKPADACCQQAALDTDRDQHRTRATVLDWWQNYTPRAGDTIV